MLGAIAGDIIGSAWEAGGEKNYDFPLFTEFSRFTDDTVMTIAVARAVLEQRDYAEMMREVGGRYPLAGYGRSFHEWILAPDLGPYNSYGNGGAMRVSAIGFSARTVEEALREAQRCAEPTHNHPEGIKGAQATALAIFMARTRAPKADIRREIAARFGYDLGRTVASIRPDYSFDVAAQRSVPEAIVCFLDGEDFEGTVRNAVSLGGDTDTMACIAGGIADAFWGGVPAAIESEVRRRLPDEFLEVLNRFQARNKAGGDTVVRLL
jgi:ADP-ribosylglycohydrolase